MQATLVFDLDNEEDSAALDRALERESEEQDYKNFLWDFEENILNKSRKWGIPRNAAEAFNEVEEGASTETIYWIIDEYYRLKTEHKIRAIEN